MCVCVCVPEAHSMQIRVGKKYRYAGIPRYFFGVVRTEAHLPVPRYSGISIFSNKKSKISKILTDFKLKQLQVEFSIRNY